MWYWLRSDESCLLFTRYSGYILQARWTNLWSSDVTFLLDSVYQKLLKSVNFWLSHYKKNQDGPVFWHTVYILLASPLPRRLWVNMISSAKPEVHEILHCRQKKTEPRPQVTCNWNFHGVWTRRSWDMRADRQTDIQTRSSQYFEQGRSKMCTRANVLLTGINIKPQKIVVFVRIVEKEFRWLVSVDRNRNIPKPCNLKTFWCLICRMKVCSCASIFDFSFCLYGVPNFIPWIFLFFAHRPI